MTIRRADVRTELDREQWSDLDSVGYEIVTTGAGEAIGGPFYFGRAFDSPPFFTFSAAASTLGVGSGPQLTVGVSEWIRDEQGMYVGANLWFRFGHINSCVVDYTYETQVLTDPGFEGGYVRGPNDGELPLLDGTPARNILWPSDVNTVVEHLGEAQDISQKYPWVQAYRTMGSPLVKFNELADNTWRENSSSSHTGTHSVDFDFSAVPDAPPLSVAVSRTPRLYPVGFTSCSLEGAAVCPEPKITTGDIVPDLGFETQLSAYGGGPEGDEIPSTNWLRERVWPSQILLKAPSGTLWQQDGNRFHHVINPQLDFFIHEPMRISTANPRTGTYHARYTTGPNDTNKSFFIELHPVQVDGCATPVFDSFVRVDPGDTINCTAFVEDNITSDGYWYFLLRWYRLNGSGIFPSPSTADDPLFFGTGSGYRPLTIGPVVVPADVVYVTASVVLFNGDGVDSTVGNTLDVDDFSMTIT